MQFIWFCDQIWTSRVQKCSRKLANGVRRPSKSRKKRQAIASVRSEALGSSWELWELLGGSGRAWGGLQGALGGSLYRQNSRSTAQRPLCYINNMFKKYRHFSDMCPLKRRRCPEVYLAAYKVDFRQTYAYVRIGCAPFVLSVFRTCLAL